MLRGKGARNGEVLSLRLPTYLSSKIRLFI